MPENLISGQDRPEVVLGINRPSSHETGGRPPLSKLTYLRSPPRVVSGLVQPRELTIRVEMATRPHDRRGWPYRWGFDWVLPISPLQIHDAEP